MGLDTGSICMEFVRPLPGLFTTLRRNKGKESLPKSF